MYVCMVQRSNPPGFGHGSAIVLSPSDPVVWWGCGTVRGVGTLDHVYIFIYLLKKMHVYIYIYIMYLYIYIYIYTLYIYIYPPTPADARGSAPGNKTSKD